MIQNIFETINYEHEGMVSCIFDHNPKYLKIIGSWVGANNDYWIAGPLFEVRDNMFDTIDEAYKFFSSTIVKTSEFSPRFIYDFIHEIYHSCILGTAFAYAWIKVNADAEYEEDLIIPDKMLFVHILIATIAAINMEISMLQGASSKPVIPIRLHAKLTEQQLNTIKTSPIISAIDGLPSSAIKDHNELYNNSELCYEAVSGVLTYTLNATIAGRIETIGGSDNESDINALNYIEDKFKFNRCSAYAAHAGMALTLPLRNTLPLYKYFYNGGGVSIFTPTPNYEDINSTKEEI